MAAARSSRALWREWGERLGLETVSADGAVAIGDAVPARLAILQGDGGVPVRAIDRHELAERLPVLAGFDGPAMIDEGGGSIRTEGAIAALAGALDDAIVTDEVLAVRPLERGGVEVVAGGGRHRHSTVLVCAGRGTAALARPLGLQPPVTLSAHIRLTFAVPRRPARAPRVPAGLERRLRGDRASTPRPCRATAPTRSASPTRSPRGPRGPCATPPTRPRWWRARAPTWRAPSLA